MDDQKKKLNLLDVYSYGDYFGGKMTLKIDNQLFLALDFDFNEIKCDHYYVAETGCQIGIITQSVYFC